MSLHTRRDGDSTIVSLSGELDLATVDDLRDTALAELSAVSTLVLDLAGLDFVDSTGLGCWIEIRNHADTQGKAVRFVDMPPSARRTVAVAGLSSLFGLDG